MANQLRTTSASSHLKNRRIFKGSQNTTWSVPEGTTEVWVHVWGGGGGSRGGVTGPQPYCCTCGSAGGGGGYSRAIYYVTDSDTLSITVGGNGGTSSVTIPTQTPGSPLSATGGGTAPDCCTAGTGGTGSVTLNPTFPTYYCMTASGGSGFADFGGGGAAGSPLGQGGNGGRASIVGPGITEGGTGGGIGASNGSMTRAQLIREDSVSAETCITCCASDICSVNLVGGSALQQNAQFQLYGPCLQTTVPGLVVGYAGLKGVVLGSIGNYVVRTAESESSLLGPNPNPCCCNCINSRCQKLVSHIRNSTSGVDWFYVEDIAGASGSYSPLNCNGYGIACVGDGAGGASATGAQESSHNSRGGFLGGGGGRGCYGTSCPMVGGMTGGCAGGSGATCTPVPGTPGAVIIYW